MIERHEKYYEMLGPSPEGVLTRRDFLRFEMVRRSLIGSSILDIGCGRADFLQRIGSNFQVAGVEVTKQRVDLCNTILGKSIVTVCNLEERLAIEDNSYDTVTCLEVLEHLIDPRGVLSELVRISKKRVIITVPFDEHLRWFLCIHCAKQTPYSGHLHSFNRDNVRDMVPDTATIASIQLLLNKVLNRFDFFLALPFPLVSGIDKALNVIIPRARWMMVIFDKHSI